MKMNTKYLITITLATLMCGVTMTSNADVGDTSIEVKLGQTDTSGFEEQAGVTVEGGSAFGVNVGYEFTSNWTAELEYIKGSVDVIGSLQSVTADVGTLAGYATFRSSGDWYFVGKIGFVSYTLTSDITEDEAQSGLTYGIGGGYRLQPNLNVELGYTIVATDTSWILLSAKYYIR